ncbi:hypothetical protein H5407_18870 [Mitsuaria sp. WAJ17]|uniref:hypothetical protein n=1 Tax=Mitsuaria sp. WAJ17 TaxID=2761452 RepID=UPI0015FFBFA9|nr:hypothetical protein [Mitsuaria sp. WAJ17]MBB2487302.1 hypothetical protein [Mitsuaria sp. WAJ17]
MDKQRSTPDQQAARDPLAATRGLSAEALARRRMLLKTAGTGGVATLAALSPMKAMAGGVTLAVCSSATTGKAVICTISGVQSAAHSFHGETYPNAWGYSPGWWGQSTYVNGKLVPARTWPCNYNVTVGSILIRASSSTKNLTLFTLMNNSAYSNTPERHWLCAYLNALAYETNTGWDKGRTGWAFPYSSTDVINFYLNNDQAAYSFFVSYLEK